MAISTENPPKLFGIPGEFRGCTWRWDFMGIYCFILVDEQGAPMYARINGEDQRCVASPDKDPMEQILEEMACKVRHLVQELVKVTEQQVPLDAKPEVPKIFGVAGTTKGKGCYWNVGVWEIEQLDNGTFINREFTAKKLGAKTPSEIEAGILEVIGREVEALGYELKKRD